MRGPKNRTSCNSQSLMLIFVNANIENVYEFIQQKNQRLRRNN